MHVGVNKSWTQYFTCLAVLCFSSLPSVHNVAKNTLCLCIERINLVIYPHNVEIGSPSCACAPAWPSSADPLNSRSIMLSGCGDNAVRKFDVSHPRRICGPVRAKSSKYGTWQGILMDYGYNHVQNRVFSDLFWLSTKSLWILNSLHDNIMLMEVCSSKL